MRTCIFSLLVLFILGLQGIAVAQESNHGIIDGQVINDTPGGGNTAGLQVCLIIYVDNEIQTTITTTTDEEGKFQFSNLAREHRYLISVTYMEVDYYYPVVFSADDGKEYVQVAVCDSTNSDHAIKVVLAHKIVDFEEESVIITEMFVLVNEGDRTYVGGEESIVDGKQGILVFTLPQGATDFKSPPELADDFLLLSESKVTYAVPFPPGESQVIFTYNLPMPKSNQLNLSFSVDYPTDYLDVMVRSDNVEVSTGQLAPAEPVETSTGEKYIHFSGQNISGDSIIEIRLDKISNTASSILIVSSVIITIIIIAPLAYFVRRRAIKQRQQSNKDSVKNE